jgi:hypothetical protein
MTTTNQIARHLADWLRESSFVPRYKWCSKTETPELTGKFLVPPDVDIEIDDDWLENARHDPREAIADLRRQLASQCDIARLSLSVKDFLLIIGD